MYDQTKTQTLPKTETEYVRADEKTYLGRDSGLGIAPEKDRNMRESITWRGEHAELSIEVVKWSFGKLPISSSLPEINWNYYVFVRESQTKRFGEFWLPPKVIKVTPESKGFVTYKYSSLDIANVDWHGGVTFYDKCGEVEGYRAVKLGCDFQHLFDMERGYPYSYEEVLHECQETAEQVKELL